jgi:hypothetical protein
MGRLGSGGGEMGRQGGAILLEQGSRGGEREGARWRGGTDRGRRWLGCNQKRKKTPSGGPTWAGAGPT